MTTMINNNYELFMNIIINDSKIQKKLYEKCAYGSYFKILFIQ